MTSASQKHYDNAIVYRNCSPTLMIKSFTVFPVPTAKYQDSKIPGNRT
jgi:hypothetical protein